MNWPLAAQMGRAPTQKFFKGECQFDVFFKSPSANQMFDASTIDQGIAAVIVSFNSHFEETFPIPPSYPANDVTCLKSFSKAITSNLLGGIGYFYSTSIIDKGFTYEWDQDDEIDAADDGQNGAQLTEPRALLIAMPSCSFFLRG
ncbi:glycoside hydrolase [Suillus spraguei]|nr:glycoside hydrolase [Suillus spraguei]